jgi:plastocyanin
MVVMKKKQTANLLIFALICLLISTCRPESDVLPGSIRIDTKISGNLFHPSVWRIPAGQKITMTITNEDKTIHDWTILARPSSLPFSPADESNIYFQVMIQPDSNFTFEFSAPQAPGEYQVLSSQKGDSQAGLVGALVVVSLPK